MANRSTQKIPHIYFENLDALRFLAALSVFVFHFSRDINGFYPSLQNHQWFDIYMVFANKGHLGVNFFFVLSGFLITYLILHEVKYKGFFSLKKFLIRRTLRIWPLYFIVVIIGFIIFPLTLKGFETSHDPWMYVAFLANFDQITHGASDPHNFLTAPWSIAVEEQFYLFWGVFLFIFIGFKGFRMWFPLLMLTIVSLSFRTKWAFSEEHLYYHTLAVCQDIVTGAFIGWSLFNGRRWLEKIKKLKKSWIVGFYLLGLGICVAKNKIFVGDLVVLERLVLSVFFAFIILDQIRGQNSFFKFGKIKSFTKLGRRSYGIYMYHLIVMFLLVKLIVNLDLNGYYLIPIYFVSSLIITLLISHLSFKFIEKPFLKMKPK